MTTTEKISILTTDDVELLVNTFYDKIRADDLLAPIFNERIQNRWPEHLNKMYTFWGTILLGERTYFGSPFVPHAKLPVDHHHFQQWLKLFNGTLDELFTGEKANEARWRAAKMAEMFEYKIKSIKEQGFESLF